MTHLWTLLAIALLPPLAIAVAAAGRGPPGTRFAGLMLASSLATPLAVALSFALDQPSSIDVALMLAVLTLPGMLLFALFAERWL